MWNTKSLFLLLLLLPMGCAVSKDGRHAYDWDAKWEEMAASGELSNAPVAMEEFSRLTLGMGMTEAMVTLKHTLYRPEGPALWYVAAENPKAEYVLLFFDWRLEDGAKDYLHDAGLTGIALFPDGSHGWGEGVLVWPPELKGKAIRGFGSGRREE